MNLGIFLPNFGHNQLAINAIAYVNAMLNKDSDIVPSLFFKEVAQPIIKPKTIMTTFDRLYNYDGHLITTNIDTTYTALQCNRLKSITFYIAELEWTRQKGNYIVNSALYRNPNIMLVCPSKEYRDAVENYCNVRINHIITGFNLNEITNRIRSRT